MTRGRRLREVDRRAERRRAARHTVAPAPARRAREERETRDARAVATRGARDDARRRAKRLSNAATIGATNAKMSGDDAKRASDAASARDKLLWIIIYSLCSSTMLVINKLAVGANGLPTVVAGAQLSLIHI